MLLLRAWLKVQQKPPDFNETRSLPLHGESLQVSSWSESPLILSSRTLEQMHRSPQSALLSRAKLILLQGSSFVQKWDLVLSPGLWSVMANGWRVPSIWLWAGQLGSQQGLGKTYVPPSRLFVCGFPWTYNCHFMGIRPRRGKGQPENEGIRSRHTPMLLRSTPSLPLSAPCPPPSLLSLSSP